MATIQQIRTAIKSKLDGLSTPAVVYDVFTSKIDGFPAVMFEPTTIASEISDVCRNERTYSFEIAIIQEMEKRTRSQCIDILLSVFQELSDSLDSDYTLGGLCEGGIKPIYGRMFVVEAQSGDTQVLTLTLECKTLHQI